MKKILINAWLPEAKIMLHGVTIYPDGLLGYNDEEFKKAIKSNPELEYDGERVIRNFINDDNDEDFEKLFEVLSGEEWIYIDDSEYIPLLFTGERVENGDLLFEGDIIEIEGQKMHIYWNKKNYSFFVKYYNEDNTTIDFFFYNLLMDSKIIVVGHLARAIKIGNIYQNPELLNTNI